MAKAQQPSKAAAGMTKAAAAEGQRRSRRLRSEEPEEIGLKSPQKKKTYKVTKTQWDVNVAAARRLGGDRDFLHRLTTTQHLAIIDNITERNERLDSENDELRQQVTAANTRAEVAESAARRKRDLQHDALQEQIQLRMQERRSAASRSSTPARSRKQQTAPESSKRTPASRKQIAQPQPEQEQVNEPERTITSPQQQQAIEPQRTSTPPQEHAKEERSLITTTSPHDQIIDEQQPESAPAPPSTPFPGLRRIFNSAASYLSPFGRRPPSQQQRAFTSVPATAPAAQRNTAPLGELVPASRKRSADVEEETPRPAKRHNAQPEQQQLTQQTSATPSVEPPTNDRRQTSATPSIEPPTTNRRQTSATPSIEPPTTSRKRSAPTVEMSDEETPRQKTPRTFLMPSTKNRRVPTSLSTVSEYTEPGSTIPSSTTPSKPPQRRTVASARAARMSSISTPSLQPLSWEKRAASATPAAPKESNADKRFAKMEKYRRLQAEIEELNKDEDIIEMESHRRKRVKVDSLAYIPHNKPGESSGTFRVPDIDSDDEMEVEYDVPERTNVFEEAARLPESLPQSQFAVAQEVEDEQMVEEEVQEQEEEEDVVEWQFPDVGPRNPENEFTAEESEQCRVDFVTGYHAWAAERGIAV